MYAGLVEEYEPANFCVTQKLKDMEDGAWELLLEKIESCSRFQRFIKIACDLRDLFEI